MLAVAVDAMGGDKAPGDILAGARAAVAQGISVVLVGPEGLDGCGDIPLIPASEVIAMDDDAAQGVRRKKDSTLVRAAEAVRDGKAAAMVSAGNTGATMASALLRMGRVQRCQPPGDRHPRAGARSTCRTSCSTPAPTPRCRSSGLAQFAQMGSIYSRLRWGIETPKVGLLSIGEEPVQGRHAAQGGLRPARSHARASSSSATSRAAT